MDFRVQRLRLVGHLRRDIANESVLDVMSRVARHEFVPPASRHLAYEDIALPIEEGQTISQPMIVAMMVEALQLKPTDRVLEVGTGSGYQAAVLSLLARAVVTTERLESLAVGARSRLASLGYHNVKVSLAGDVLGCPDKAPFDAIVVAAGGPHLPRVLLDQLAEGGRLVLPVGSRREQELTRVEKTRDGYSMKRLGPCRFVPLIGPGAWSEHDEDGIWAERV
jgi:protein-L-isoaspartate(D-aspartate) O-methyltransferase